MPPKKFKSFKVEPLKIPFVDSTNISDPMRLEENMYEFKAGVSDNLEVEGVFKHVPQMGPDALKRITPGKLNIRGIGLKQKNYQGIWETLPWEAAKGKLSTGHIRELIRNAQERFPDIEKIRGLRVTGVRGTGERNLLDAFQEIRVKPKKSK